MSSVGVYSPAEKFLETDVWKTLPSENDWFPSWSKRTGELLLEACKVQYGYDKWSIIRPANIFGDYDDFSGNGTVISTTIKKIWESDGTMECWGDGSPTRDFVYGYDVAEAIYKMYTEKIHDIVNFGSGEEITIKSMIEDLILISKKNISINWDSTKPNGDLRRQMDITRQEKYNLLPTTSFKQALEKTYYYYISQFKAGDLSFLRKDLFDSGFYVGTLDEIFTDIDTLNGKIEELKSLSKTKEHYSARFDYNLDDSESKYKISLNEEEMKEREIQLKVELKQKDEYIFKLEESLEKANKTIADIAMQPKTTNNTNTNSRIHNETHETRIINNFDINDIKIKLINMYMVLVMNNNSDIEINMEINDSTNIEFYYDNPNNPAGFNLQYFLVQSRPHAICDYSYRKTTKVHL